MSPKSGEPRKVTLDCSLCKNAWSGAQCLECPLYGSKHYIHSDGPAKTDCFIISEAPTVGPSIDPYKHIAWSAGPERSVKTILNSYRSSNVAYQNLEMYFTYAVHCEVEKPPAAASKCCLSILKEKIEKYSNPDAPIVILAFGPGVLKALGVKFTKHQDAVGQIHEITLYGRPAFVYASISLRQMMVKAGFIELVRQHVNQFMQHLLIVKKGLKVSTVANVTALSKEYVFPRTIEEVNNLVDYICNYSPSGKSSGNQLIALDTETNTLYPHRNKLQLLTLTVAWDPGKAASIPIEHAESPLSLDSVREAVSRLLLSPNPKVGHNIKFDLKVLLRKGFHVNNVVWDTMVCEHLLAEDKKGFYGLKELTRRYFPAYANYEQVVRAKNKENLYEARKEAKLEGKKLSKAEESLLEDDGYANIPLKDLSVYGAIDADITWQLTLAQRRLMFQESKDFVALRKNFFMSTNAAIRDIGKVLWANENPEKVLSRGMLHDPLIRMAQNRTIPTLQTLARMEDRGVMVDRAYTQELAIKMEHSMRVAIIKLNDMIPQGVHGSFNPASSQQIRNTLYNTGFVHPETKELVCYEGKVIPPTTDKGAISTNAQFLRLLVTKNECPFSKALLEFRAMQKARNTFIENIMVLTREDNRMHTHYHQQGTSSGRLSSSHENMQNIPKKIGEHNIKKIFIPSDPSLAFVNTDAKAAEVRIYAAYSHDANLIRALNDGLDPHSFVASMVYKPENVLKGVHKSDQKTVMETVGIDLDHAWSYDDFCARDSFKDNKDSADIAKYGKSLDKLRSIIKRVVFGILYGASPAKVSSVVGIPDEQAKVIVDALFNMFPSIPEYISITKKQLENFGFVETFFGRRRRFGELSKLPFSLRNKAERQSVNFKIQSTSSDIVMEVLQSIEAPLLRDFRGKLLLTVHDSIGFECPKGYVSQIPDFIKEYGTTRIGKNYPWLPVPFQWDVEAGPSYGELMSIPKYIESIKDLAFIVPNRPEDNDDYIEQEIREDLDAHVMAS